MAKKVPVTSVTPASKVKATSKTQQARTRGLVMGIATSTPAGRVAKAGTTAVKAAARMQKLSATEKAKVKEVKYVAKNAKPGSVSKMLDKLPLEEKRAYSEALRKSIPAKKKAAVYKKTSVDSPARVKTKIMNSRGKIITIKEN